jgi:hypothetical protein
MERVGRDFGPRGLAILAINLGEGREIVARYARGKGLTSTVLLDPAGVAGRAYRVTATPTVFVVGRDGRLVAKALGTMEWTGPAGRAFLEALVER